MTKRTDAILRREWIELRRRLGLSRGQIEIVRQLFRGKSHQEIAREMAIQPRTVRTPVEHLYRQFGVSNRVQLVLHVLTVLHKHREAGKKYLST